MKLDANAKETLLDAAWQVIRSGVSASEESQPAVRPGPSELERQGASFITLTRDSNLRGCCGTVEAHQPLIDDVAENAWKTAFSDPRFEPLVESELAGLLLEISVLSPLRQIAARDQQQLLSNLQPDLDGLLICSGKFRATFLPKVWVSLKDPEIFLQQLMVKANMPLNHWPQKLTAYVYTAEIFGKDAGD